MRIQIDAPAKAELRDAVRWYLDEVGALAARSLATEVRRVMARIRENPRLSPEIEPGIRRALLARFPYSIMYTIEVEQIRVFAIAHQRRRPGYWRRR